MALETTLPSAFVSDLLGGLKREAAVSTISERPRPVHVVYGGAHLFDARTVAKIGERASLAMDTWGKDAATFGQIVGLRRPELADELAERVRKKLRKQPVEAFTIDFEDGYGPRTDDEEDAAAVRAASELGAGAPSAAAIGIRIKALAGSTTERAIRTLDLFVSTLARSRGGIPPRFSVTLPKVTSPRQVEALATLLEQLEAALGCSRLDVELMVESPTALFGRGALAIPALIEAARGRAVALHLGAYDFTAELGVTASDQRLDHPYCDLARMLLRLGAYGTDVGISDGATTLMPVAPKGTAPEAAAPDVHRAWSIHAANVRRAIDVGIWQGWDLHPAQLPARFGAFFGYFLAHRAEMAERLRTFVERASQASLLGQAFDDAATGLGLVGFFARGLACGALDEDDLRVTSLTKEELGLPFAELVQRRRGEKK